VVFYPTFLIFLVPILFIGFSGVVAFPGVEPADAILPTVITSLGLPAFVVGLFCAGALAASMSTGDALLHAAASVVARDLYAPFARSRPSDAAEPPPSIPAARSISAARPSSTPGGDPGLLLGLGPVCRCSIASRTPGIVFTP
jgi:uncharacterized sodium:solute symporter family permease YidK